ncbi:MAG: Adenylosuccinate synthetase (EC [uncultured Campylobacterales bacterium]|uniref:Adenylosuccinate synthetase n=1 Tax=uncultured Campylobacterales bacterium TaxID=352960 RepID=A0A6S6SCF5_9BACT|nr:MAG: Adenylosuccinate synthetase (EC [uncultured Campylobacterales bacterium]
MSKADVIVGLQWGDEGKGKVVDILAQEMDVVARFQGGHNAGHTIVINGKKTALRLIPSGAMNKKSMNVIGGGVVVAPYQLIEELKQFDDKLKNRLYVSEKAHIIFKHYEEIDVAREKLRGKKAIGTTGNGIGPAYSNKTSRTGHRIGELRNIEKLVNDLQEEFESSKVIYKAMGITLPNKEELKKELEFYYDELKDYIKDTNTFVWDSLKNGKKVLLEGAQATLLDIDHGTYPYVTSSNTSISGAMSGLGLSHKDIGNVIGIAKAYCTRVGNGVFPSEDFGEDAVHMAKVGHEFGTVTGRARRCGWFDAVAIKYACRLNGCDELAVMKLDVLDGLKKVKVCVAYEQNGKIIKDFPMDLDNITPVYEEFDGWDSTEGIRDFDKLPVNAKKYLEKLSEIVGMKIAKISTSPERDDLINR